MRCSSSSIRASRDISEATYRPSWMADIMFPLLCPRMPHGGHEDQVMIKPQIAAETCPRKIHISYEIGSLRNPWTIACPTTTEPLFRNFLNALHAGKHTVRYPQPPTLTIDSCKEPLAVLPNRKEIYGRHVAPHGKTKDFEGYTP
jgi:hypothetical protein